LIVIRHHYVLGHLIVVAFVKGRRKSPYTIAFILLSCTKEYIKDRRQKPKSEKPIKNKSRTKMGRDR